MNIKKTAISYIALGILIGAVVLFMLLSLGSDDNEASQKASSPFRRSPASMNVFIVRPMGNELRFDVTEIRVKAGSQVKIIMENTASITSMPHNVTILKDDTALNRVITAATQVPGYIPLDAAILASTGTASPEASTDVVFTSPEPGVYTYLCTVPGHANSMRGVLIVE